MRSDLEDDFKRPITLLFRGISGILHLGFLSSSFPRLPREYGGKRHPFTSEYVIDWSDTEWIIFFDLACVRLINSRRCSSEQAIIWFVYFVYCLLGSPDVRNTSGGDVIISPSFRTSRFLGEGLFLFSTSLFSLHTVHGKHEEPSHGSDFLKQLKTV